MKTKVISELISVFVIGTLFGLEIYRIHLKWHSAGRESFLFHESQLFDKAYSAPSSLIHCILVWFLVALLVYALFKAITYVSNKVLSSMISENETA
jgi:hypothetical protein